MKIKALNIMLAGVLIGMGAFSLAWADEDFCGTKPKPVGQYEKARLTFDKSEDRGGNPSPVAALTSFGSSSFGAAGGERSFGRASHSSSAKPSPSTRKYNAKRLVLDVFFVTGLVAIITGILIRNPYIAMAGLATWAVLALLQVAFNRMSKRKR